METGFEDEDEDECLGSERRVLLLGLLGGVTWKRTLFRGCLPVFGWIVNRVVVAGIVGVFNVAGAGIVLCECA